VAQVYSPARGGLARQGQVGPPGARCIRHCVLFSSSIGSSTYPQLAPWLLLLPVFGPASGTRVSVITSMSAHQKSSFMVRSGLLRAWVTRCARHASWFSGELRLMTPYPPPRCVSSAF